MVWILVAVGIMALILLLIGIYVWRKEGQRHETDYKAFFHMGLVWIIIAGAYMILTREYSLVWLFSMGVIFFVLGLANKDKWGRTRKMTDQGRKRIMLMILVGIALLVLGTVAFLLYA